MEYILDTSDGIYNARMTGELIRCRDCKNCLHIMTDRYVCTSFVFTVKSDDYCSFAEKREEKK